ncbi:MAG: O-antigen ligase domain-containing protein, partial [Candidatus Dadabacteria bacterium]
MPYLILLLAWCLIRVFVELDPAFLYTVYRGEKIAAKPSILNLVSWLKKGFEPSFTPFYYFYKALLFFSFWTVFSLVNEKLKISFKKGILLGIILSLLLSFIQIYTNNLSLFNNTNSFWKMLNRFSGTFEDPNAFGIGAFFVIGFLLYLFNKEENNILKKVSLLFLIFAYFLTALYSGSRSFIIGTVLLFLSYYWQRKRFLATVLLASFLGVLLLLFSYLPSIVNFTPSWKRIFSGFNLKQIAENTKSRVIFNKIGTAIFLDNPLVGVGFKNFSEKVVPYSSKLNLKTGVWQDNPNNFYLGIAAELGVLGILALCLLIKALALNRSSPYLPISFIFLFLLLLG